MRIKGIYGEVINILRDDPQTRSSDKALYVAWLTKHAPAAIGAPFITTLYNSSLPSIESVGRARRKAQETYPELAADANVAAERELMEEEYKEFARGF